MSSMWERTLVYLGLREEPDDQVEWDVLAAADAQGGPAAPGGRAAGAAAGAAGAAAGARPVQERRVIPPSAAPAPQPQPTRSPNVRVIREDAGSAAPAGPRGARVVVVHLRSFEDVEAVGANHRAGRPVLLDVAACDQPIARRVVDFVSGMTYVSGGSLRRIAARAYLLMPTGVTLDAEERDRLAQAGYPLDVRDGDGAR